MALKNINWQLKILEKAEEIAEAEELQRQVWPGNETEIVPLHVLVTAAQNGGLVIGAYLDTRSPEAIEQDLPPESPGPLIGFVFGYPGLYFTPDGPRPKHNSQELGVLPEYTGQGLGFALKRAQWQMVRHQGLDLITWTYDPLLSRNAYLNIARLGAVCCTYKPDMYGDLRDQLNQGLPSDRFQVDWWINTSRVQRRLSRKARPPLDLAHFLAAETPIINPSYAGKQEHTPSPNTSPIEVKRGGEQEENLLLLEIPSDFQALKATDRNLALEWRLHTRILFEDLFRQGYWVTDFIYLPGMTPRSYYVLSHGESVLLVKKQ